MAIRMYTFVFCKWKTYILEAVYTSATFTTFCVWPISDNACPRELFFTKDTNLSNIEQLIYRAQNFVLQFDRQIIMIIQIIMS